MDRFTARGIGKMAAQDTMEKVLHPTLTYRNPTGYLLAMRKPSAFARYKAAFLKENKLHLP